MTALRAIVDQSPASPTGGCLKPASDCDGSLAAGLEYLAEAYRFVRELKRDPWDFAVEMQYLLREA